MYLSVVRYEGPAHYCITRIDSLMGVSLKTARKSVLFERPPRRRAMLLCASQKYKEMGGGGDELR